MTAKEIAENIMHNIEYLASRIAEQAVPHQDDSFREWSTDMLKLRVRVAVKETMADYLLARLPGTEDAPLRNQFERRFPEIRWAALPIGLRQWWWGATDYGKNEPTPDLIRAIELHRQSGPKEG